MIPFKGKAQSLAFLKGIGLNVPDFRVISHEQLLSWGDPQILQTLKREIEEKLRKLIPLTAFGFAATIKIPEIIQLERMNRSWAIRSSASMEDSPEHSFAGIFRSELGIPDDLTPCVKAVWASLYSENALTYCEERKISWDKLSMDVILQEMVVGEKSGVLFQGENTIINAALGVASRVSSGSAEADLYVVNKTEVTHLMVAGNSSTLTDLEIDQLLAASEKIKTHCPHPLDLEFTFRDDVLYFLQARPITSTPPLPLQSSKAVGIPCSRGVAEGICHVNPDALSEVKGKIIVLRDSSLIYDFIFKGVQGVIVEGGSLLSHTGILSRELGIPCIIHAKNATTILKSGTKLRLDGNQGSYLIL